MSRVPLPPDTMSVGEAILWLAGILGALGIIWRWVLPAIRKTRWFAQMGVRALEVLLGTPAIPDPDRPGEFLREAVPDMGVRMTAVESTLSTLAIANLDARMERTAADAQQARQAADHAARDARLALKGVNDLKEAAEVWHANEIDVLRDIENRVQAAHPATTQEGSS